MAALRHAFTLAARQDPPLVVKAPHIALLKERNRRVGFFKWEDFATLREHLPEYLKAPVTVAYYTGWRLASEILTRKRAHLVDGWLVLEPNEARNEEPRRFPLEVIPELAETVQRQLETTRALEVKEGRAIEWLFHRKGNRVVDYLPASRRACAAAGLTGKVPHDFRRTAARNLINAGVDLLTTMKLVGWESIEMLKRYNIIDDETLKGGVFKLHTHLVEQKHRHSVAVALDG